jgi:hypothetical protein
LIPTASGLVRRNSHCRPILAERHVDARSSFVVMGLGAFEDKAQLQVVLQVLTHARKIAERRNAELLQQGAGPMPDSCSSCGLCSEPAESITSRAAGHALRLAILTIFDADRPGTFEQNARDMRADLDREVRPLLAGRR